MTGSISEFCEANPIATELEITLVMFVQGVFEVLTCFGADEWSFPYEGQIDPRRGSSSAKG